MDQPAYRRVVVKLSGEYLAGSQSFGIDQPTIDRIAGDETSGEFLEEFKIGGEILEPFVAGQPNQRASCDHVWSVSVLSLRLSPTNSRRNICTPASKQGSLRDAIEACNSRFIARGNCGRRFVHRTRIGCLLREGSV